MHLNAKTINFGEVSIGKRNTRLLNVENYSPLPTKFQFYVDPNNMFSFDRTCGIVPPNSSVRIIINFSPSRTNIYYERAYCIVKNHSILYVDLLGTCSDILTKPMPIMQRHVDLFRHRAANEMAVGEEEKMSMEIPMDMAQESNAAALVTLCKDMMLDQTSDSRKVSLSEQFVDFGYQEIGRSSEFRQIKVTNRYGFPVRVYWVVKDTKDSTGQTVPNPFKFDDVNTDGLVPAGGETTFNIRFKPFDQNYLYFFQTMQCFVYLLNGNENRL